jgi:hypothetical protein
MFLGRRKFASSQLVNKLWEATPLPVTYMWQTVYLTT